VRDVVHTRRFLFVKPDYWVVVDEVRSPARYDYELLFHAAPEIDVTNAVGPLTGERL
jgi:hypothetical protein